VRGLVAGVLLLVHLVVAVPAASGAESDVARARARANAAAAALAEAQTNVATIDRELAAVEARQQVAADRARSARAALREAAVDQYISGAGTVPPLVLDLADASAAARFRALRSLLAAGSADAAEVYSIAAAELAVEGDRLASARSSAAGALAAYRKQQSATAAELRRLVAADAERAKLAASTRRAAQRSTPSTPVVIGGGAWICPVQGPRAFSDDYGDARAGGRRHAGNDILAPRGTPVVAPVAGRASRHDNRLGGISFYLYGSDGTTYYGAHLDSYSGASGNVAAGTVLGYVGNSGDARNGPTHLHFEIHPGGGRDINPYPTLRRYC
jgi:murein DD-endopeptidase MepM/ murein hydrolase activator NlpD